ncbi:MAG: protein kinase [Anaerolineae bacterium]
MDIGRIIATRYRIDQVIGHGGMGDIYLGTDLVENRDVAVKRLKKELIQSDPDVVERFLREGDIQQRLTHPAVVRVYEALQFEDDYLIVMEYVKGGTLSALMKRQEGGKLPYKQAIEIGVSLTGALQEAHDKGIIHRDLKPSNIIMTIGGKPRLTDFGAAKLHNSQKLTVTGMVIGTYSYMSPESCRGQEVDGRADVWSFGILLFEMLTGTRPFDQDNPMELMLAIMREPPADIQRLNPDIPDQVADLIYRMLAKDINRRIPSMALIEAELNRILDGNVTGYFTSLHAKLASTSELLAVREPTLPDYGPLLGRHDERSAALKLIADPDCRLITLQGAGGMGKTHLAVDLAKTVKSDFHDGVFFVNLTDIKNPDNILAAIAASLRFQFFGSEKPIQQLNSFLTNKNLLLIIDNFEQVMAGADLLPMLLKGSPDVQILLTSRERVNLKDEQRVTLDGLSPGESFELFIQTARRIRSDYSPNSEETVAIKEICQLLDGSPLAIELAAGWVNMLTAPEIVEEMDDGMGFLESHIRDVPERHRSIRTISENSWKLLNDSERDAMRRLSVFRGGFQREAVRKIVGASLLTLNSLIDKSLLRRSAESGLYSMQELLRWFAAEKLQEMSPDEILEVKEAHAHYYLDYLKTLTPKLVGGGQIKSLAGIEKHLANIQSALNTAIEIKNEGLIEAWIDGMYWFYLMRGRQQEGVKAIRRATFASTIGAKNGLIQVKMMSRLGAYSRFIGEFDSAKAILQESLKLARELKVPEEISFALYQLGAVRPDASGSPAMWQEAFEIAETIRHGWLIAEIANWLAFYNFQTGNIDDAISWLERGLEERRRLGDSYGLAIILTNLGFVQMQMGDLGKAKKLLEEALQINKEIRNFNGIGAAWNNLAYIALSEGEIEEAEKAANQALVYYDQSGNHRGRGEALGNLIGVDIHNGNYNAAEETCHECIQLFREMKLPVHAYVKEQGRIALARNLFNQARIFFKEALLETSNASHKLGVLAGFGELLIKEKSDPAGGLQLLQFVLKHEATEPGVRRSVQAALAASPESAPPQGWVAGHVARAGGLPDSVEAWLEYLAYQPVKSTA